MSDNIPAPSVATQIRQANSDVNGECLVCNAEPDWQCDEVVHRQSGSATYGHATLPARGWKLPKPTVSTCTDVLDMVVKDLTERSAIGTIKHCHPLRLNNGRDVLLDAYHEALDLVIYLRQEIEERRCSHTLLAQAAKEGR